MFAISSMRLISGTIIHYPTLWFVLWTDMLCYGGVLFWKEMIDSILQCTSTWLFFFSTYFDLLFFPNGFYTMTEIVPLKISNAIMLYLKSAISLKIFYFLLFFLRKLLSNSFSHFLLNSSAICLAFYWEIFQIVLFEIYSAMTNV